MNTGGSYFFFNSTIELLSGGWTLMGSKRELWFKLKFAEMLHHLAFSYNNMHIDEPFYSKRGISLVVIIELFVPLVVN